MVDLIATIILGSSLIGIAVILFRKIPVLIHLPKTTGEVPGSFLLRARERVGALPGMKSFSYDIFLEKLLSRARILILKTENKTSHWLENLRRKNNQKNNHNNDNYWEELKKAKNGK